MNYLKNIKEVLRKYLSEKRDNVSLRIEDISQFTQALETEIYSLSEIFTINNKEIINKLVLRMYPKSYLGFGVKHEYKIMQNLLQEGFQVPSVLFFEEVEEILGKPFMIMEFIEGETLNDKFSKSSADQIPELMYQFTSLMVSLHRLEWKKFITDKTQIDTNDPYFATNFIIDDLRLIAKEFNKKEYQPTIKWLQDKKVNYPVENFAFIHGDFHPLNIIVAENNSLFVIDWGQSRISDIRDDIAHTSLLFIMFGASQLNPLLFKYYEELSGNSIGDLVFYEVSSAFKLLIYLTLQIGNFDLNENQAKLMSIIQSLNPMLQRAYNYLVERTNIRIPEFEIQLGLK
jgi:aminoglycoside phosphotransferase (APT) family kinase protein